MPESQAHKQAKQQTAMSGGVAHVVYVPDEGFEEATYVGGAVIEVTR